MVSKLEIPSTVFDFILKMPLNLQTLNYNFLGKKSMTMLHIKKKKKIAYK